MFDPAARSSGSTSIPTNKASVMQKRNNPLLFGGTSGAARVDDRPKADPSDLRAAEMLTDVYGQMTRELGRVIVGQNDVLK
jgi:hypothetical protein